MIIRNALIALDKLYPVCYIQQLFPELAPLAKQSVNLIKDPEVLQDLGYKMFSVYTSEEARQFLFSMRDSSEEI